jgi:hypothetical protein
VIVRIRGGLHKGMRCPYQIVPWLGMSCWGEWLTWSVLES